MSGLEDQFIRCFRFEHTSKNICVGTRTGIRFIDYSDPLELRCVPRLNGVKICLLELIPDTDILMYVTDAARKKLIFHDFNNFQNFPAPIEPKHYTQFIVRMRANKERILVAVEDAIFIYSKVDKGGNVKLLSEIALSGQISGNIVDLSEHPVNSYIAYPSFDRVGHFFVHEPSKPGKKITVQAHDSQLVAITFDPNGRTVASASEHGILIKVNRAFNGECVYEFRRGITLNISITSLSFSKDAKFLCANDTTNNLKIYKLDYSASIVNTGSSWLRETFQPIAESLLPEHAARLLFDENPFARAKLPESNACKAICTIHRNGSNSHLLVVNTDGLVYAYSINTINGGQCELLKSFSIEDDRYVENAADTWIMV